MQYNIIPMSLIGYSNKLDTDVQALDVSMQQVISDLNNVNVDTLKKVFFLDRKKSSTTIQLKRGLFSDNVFPTDTDVITDINNDVLKMTIEHSSGTINGGNDIVLPYLEYGGEYYVIPTSNDELKDIIDAKYGSNGSTSVITGISIVKDDDNTENLTVNNFKANNICTTLVTSLYIANNGIFKNRTNFNDPVDKWDVSNVTDMTDTFRGCAFDGALNNWDVSNVDDMESMFQGNTVFNQPLNKWNVSNVTSLANMFHTCRAFNQSLNEWDVHNVTDTNTMFLNCNKFNKPLNKWDVSSVTSMGLMFSGCSEFNQSLNNWDVSKVTNMKEMFTSASKFNKPLNSWDVSSVVNVKSLFKNCVAFNQPLNSWDVSSVTNMGRMFENSAVFNQPLNNWDVSSVTDMGNMFTNASNFNQDISTWNVNNVTNSTDIFSGCPIDPGNQPTFS